MLAFPISIHELSGALNLLRLQFAGPDHSFKRVQTILAFIYNSIEVARRFVTPQSRLLDVYSIAQGNASLNLSLSSSSSCFGCSS